MSVIIGVDPHKASHTAVAIGGDEREVKVTVRATCHQTAKLFAWADPSPSAPGPSSRPVGWVICWPNSSSMPAKMSSMSHPPWPRGSACRHGAFRQDDPNDALSVAVAALRSNGLRTVEAADHTEIMRLLAKRNHDLGRLRARLVRRLHNALADLSPGGIAKELYVSDAMAPRLLRAGGPNRTHAHQLALELVHDVARLDEQIKESHRRISTAVRESKTSLTDLYGVGPFSPAR